MTKAEVGRLITYLSDNFKNFEKPSKDAAEIWVDALKGASRKEVNNAIKKHMKTSAYPIHLSDILKSLPSQEDYFKGMTEEEIRDKGNKKVLKRFAMYERN